MTRSYLDVLWDISIDKIVFNNAWVSLSTSTGQGKGLTSPTVPAKERGSKGSRQHKVWISPKNRNLSWLLRRRIGIILRTSTACCWLHCDQMLLRQGSRSSESCFLMCTLTNTNSPGNATHQACMPHTHVDRRWLFLTRSSNKNSEEVTSEFRAVTPWPSTVCCVNRN